MTMNTGAVPTWGLGDRLRKALEYADVSVQDMAKELGLSRNSISNYMHGHRNPRRADLLVWALKCGVDPEWLMTGKVLVGAAA